MFSKYELLFLDKGNFSSNPFQVLPLQYPIPEASLPPLPFMSSFTLANWNPSLTYSSSCSSSVALFFPTLFNRTPHLLDVPNQMSSQANQVCYQFIFKPIINFSKSWVSKSRFSFKIRHHASRSTKTLFSTQSVLNSLQNVRCSLIFTTLLMHATTLTVATKTFL